MALAYAALVSLMNVLNRVQHPTCHGSLDISQVKSLSDKVSSLVDLLEAYSHRISEGLDRKMTDAAFAAEDTIESYLVGIQRSTSNREVLNENLDKETEEMDSLIQEAMQAKEKGEKDELSRNSVPGVGTPVHPSEAMEMVGFEEETNYLIGQLTARQSIRQVIPIVGMGGLGKTTLATSIYNHPHLRHQFDVKAWVTVSQVYTSRSIILPVLRGLGIDEKDHIGDNELGVRLHKELWSRKYLIVLDDIWDSQAWDEISRFCPDNNNGSRILLTTRRSDVATSVGSCSPFELQLLDGDKSWVLLSNKVFGQKVCPPELESCGKKIAMNCKGLPLAIAVIGGLLKMSIQIRERWEHVERDTRSMVSVEDDEHCMKILSLSYHQLAVHLKPCLLYMATFPEDYEIRVSEVTKLWAADGFLKANVGGESLEDVAIRCLTDLVSRNLMMVRKRNHRGGIKCLSVHDLVRVLCIKEAEKMKFLYVDAGVIRCLDSIECQRRVVSHANGSMLYRDMLQTGFCRSFIWFQRCNLTPEISSSPLLRVLFAR